MPSGNHVVIDVYTWGMNMQLFINGRVSKTEGLCGSFDGNRTNDLIDRHTRQAMPDLINGQAVPQVVESWR